MPTGCTVAQCCTDHHIALTASAPVWELLMSSTGGREPMIRRASFVVVVAAMAVLGARTPAPAFHRQTPPLVQLTSSGDNSGILPRVHPEFFAPLTLRIDTATLDPGYFRKQLLPSVPGFGNGGHTSIVRQNWF